MLGTQTSKRKHGDNNINTETESPGRLIFPPLPILSKGIVMVFASIHLSGWYNGGVGVEGGGVR